MSDHYQHEIIDSAGTRHPFSLTVENKGASGELVWPPETSRLEAIRRVTESRITALIVWSTMKIRCWIAAAADEAGTDLEITFATTPYRYRIEDEGAFVKFIGGLALPHAAAGETHGDEQPAPPGWAESASDGRDDAQETGNCGTQVYVRDRSTNDQYAYYFLINEADQPAGVTILNTWMYQGELRRETKRYDLYPGEEKEVFSFPRAQDPKCTITHCRLG